MPTTTSSSTNRSRGRRSGEHDLALEQGAVGPSNLSTPLLVDEQPTQDVFFGDFAELGEFRDADGGVEFEVGFDDRVEACGSDFGKENPRVVIDRIWVLFRVRPIGRGGVDESWATRAEEFFEHWDGFGPTALKSYQLFAVPVAQAAVDRVVEFRRRKRHANCHQAEHLIVHFGNGVVGRGVFLGLQVPRAAYVDKDVAEHADRVGVTAEHQVAEAHVVIRCKVRGEHTRKCGFFGEFDVVKGFQREGIVPQQAMNAEEADDREIAQVTVQWFLGIV